MRRLDRWFMGAVAATALVGLGGGKMESHMGEYGPAFEPTPPLVGLGGGKMEGHMGEYGPAFPISPKTSPNG